MAMPFLASLFMADSVKVVCIVVVDGLVKETTPGSLREPASTYLLPSNWLALPLAYGLLASPWGAHSVFPSVSTSILLSFMFPRTLSYLTQRLDLPRYAASSKVEQGRQDHFFLLCMIPPFKDNVLQIGGGDVLIF